MESFSYYCNPAVFDELKKRLNQFAYPPEMPFLPPGFRLVPNPAVPKHPTRWVFPKNRIIEHEPSDEPWCRYFKIGHEEEDKTRWLFMRIQEPAFGRFWMHPVGLTP